jgi:hypothetical protein
MLESEASIFRLLVIGYVNYIPSHVQHDLLATHCHGPYHGHASARLPDVIFVVIRCQSCLTPWVHLYNQLQSTSFSINSHIFLWGCASRIRPLKNLRFINMANLGLSWMTNNLVKIMIHSSHDKLTVLIGDWVWRTYFCNVDEVKFFSEAKVGNIYIVSGRLHFIDHYNVSSEHRPAAGSLRIVHDICVEGGRTTALRVKHQTLQSVRLRFTKLSICPQTTHQTRYSPENMKSWRVTKYPSLVHQMMLWPKLRQIPLSKTLASRRGPTSTVCGHSSY